MQYSEIINDGTLVYKSQPKDSKLREWSVKETVCAVRFYKTEPLTELEVVMLRLINSLEGNKITKEDIALTLGFDVADRGFGGKRFYRDQAEVSLFNSMIDSVFKWHLVVEETEEVNCCLDEQLNVEVSEGSTEENADKKAAIKYIRLTGLGKKALEMNCKFSFFDGKKCILENVNKSILPIDTIDFPFYSALGVCSEITDIVPVEEFNPDQINIDYSDDLINRINLQSNRSTNVFEASMLPEWKYYSKYFDVCLYQYSGEYYPIVMLDDKVSSPATDILFREQNAYLFNKKIKKALYSKLINNADSTINYNEIRFFEDEIEQEEFDFIVRDKRTDWSDSDTYNYVVRNVLCNDNNWDYISRCCPEDIIISHLAEPYSRFDMIMLSRRLPIHFIIEYCANYKWDMSIVLSRNDITKEQAQELMLCDENTSVEWDWEIVEPFLDVDFVINNIERLNIDFYNLTSWLPSNHQDLIVKYCNKRWNWLFVAKEADITLVTDSIDVIKDYIAAYTNILLDRIFTDPEFVKSIVSNRSFAEVIKVIKSNGQLNSYNLGSKSNYIWSDDLIKYLEDCSLLSWKTIGTVKGFAQFPYVEWTPEFFKKYHHKIDTPDDFSYISEKVSDLALIKEYSDFEWDWNALSRNTSFSLSEEFLVLGKDKVLYSEWMRVSNKEFTLDFFASHNQWMRSDENASYVSSVISNYDAVLEYSSFPWNWCVLAKNKAIVADERFCTTLSNHREAISPWLNLASPEQIEQYFDELGLAAYIDGIDERLASINLVYCSSIWTRLSSILTIDFIYSKIKENWDKTIISQRLVPLFEEVPERLDSCKENLDWNVLSQNLSVDFIQGNFANYVDYWDWSVITQRVDAVFLHLHFKEYISFWNQGIAIEKITPLLSYDDIVDSELERVWDWDLISARVEDSVLIKILAEKMDFLDWDIVSSRICNIADNDFATLIDNNPVVSEHLDWDYINENMALSEILKYRDLHNASWDWSIITRRFDTDFVVDNLSKYASYWDWNVILNEKIQQTYVKENLDHVRDAIAVLEDNIKKSCWTTISRLYSPVELLEISEIYNPTNGYEWDYSYIYSTLTDIDGFVNEAHAYIDRKALSACKAADNMFEYDSETYVYRTWKTIIKSKLNDDKYKWDFSSLTRLDAIQKKNDVFFEIKPDCWDWNYISQFGICLLPNHKGKYLRKYRDRLNFGLISTREDIDIDDDMVQSFIGEEWNWKALSANKCTRISFDFIFENRDKAWDWNALSKNSSIKWNDKKLREILKDSVIKSSISWDDVVSKRELQFDDALLDLMKDINFCWYNLSSNPSFIPSIDSLKRAFEKSAEINWSALSKNQHIDLSFVREYKDFLDWKILTSNKKVVDINEENILDEFAKLLDWSYVSENIKLTNHILVKYKDSLIWKIVNERFNYNEFDLSNIETVKDFIDWTKLSSASIVFPEEFLHQYRNKIDWVAFSKNDSVDFSADLYKDFEKELNRVKFVDILSHCNTNGYSSLKVYHFSHMFNAIDIIKNRKILSRNKAEESKALKYDAAGAVVHRTNKAHPYARFYFRPKSPTQFYNECLGWDDTLLTHWSKPKSYYSEACNLHLPKCPLPVFFEFDICEIIAKMPEKCYYSNGNMQTNFASVYKVDVDPTRIRTQYLYNDISDAFYMVDWHDDNAQALHRSYIGGIKEQSQQEFLVMDELDFSKLDSLKIFCYDEFQKELLIKYLGDDEIVDRIEVNHAMYSYDKRSLEMSEDDNSITISSDYDLNGCAYILVKGGSIVNKKAIKNEISSGIIIYPSVTFNKNNPPSEIYLVDPNPRADTKQWLIYKS